MNINKLLPEKISDEGAYHLVTFLMELAMTLESRYFAQMRRHIVKPTPNSPDNFIAAEFDDEFPF